MCFLSTRKEFWEESGKGPASVAKLTPPILPQRDPSVDIALFWRTLVQLGTL